MRPEKFKIPTSGSSRLRMWPANRIHGSQHLSNPVLQNDECAIVVEEVLPDDGISGSRPESDSVLEEKSSDDGTSEPQPGPDSPTQIETFDMVIRYNCGYWS